MSQFFCITMSPTFILLTLSCVLQCFSLGDGAAAAVVRVTDSEIKLFTEEIFNSDENNTGDLVKLDLQKKYSHASSNDVCPKPLFNIPPRVWNIKTYNLLMALFKHERLEDTTADDREGEKRFLEAVLQTQVMNKTMSFLQKAGVIKGGLRQFKEILDQIWFTVYPRGGIASSGFKHVFMAEMKKASTGLIVNGMHNWLFFALEERNRAVEYMGWKAIRQFNSLGNTKGSVISIKFKWRGMTKETGSMFVGTSPELEMALYTTCFLVRRNSECRVELGGASMSIQTYTQQTRNGEVVGTAYPIV